MSDLRTHREQKPPQMSARMLADYMAASEIAKRSIIVSAKYRSIARVIQHNDAKSTIAKFLRGEASFEWLAEEAERIRNRMTDDYFDENLNEINADYIVQFARSFPRLKLPEADIVASGPMPALTHGGFRVTAASDIRLRLRRVNRKNKIKVGGATFRYAKGRSLSEEAALWQSAFIHGYLARKPLEADCELDSKLCVTIDAYSGTCWQAPSNSVQPFNQIMAACASIGERWPNVRPPAGAILQG